MIFTPHQPPESLAPYIGDVFHYEQFVPDHSIERVVSTGNIYLLFELDDQPRHTYDADTLTPNGTYTGVWIYGMHRNHISISAANNSSMLAIQFKPGGSHPFLHVDVSRLNELIVPVQDLIGEELLELRKEMMATGSAAHCFELIDQWLLQRFDSSRCPPAQLLSFIDSLQQAPATALKQLIEDYPASQKTLIDQFKQYVGLTPKYFQRILRFNDLLQRIRDKQTLSWTDIAHDCGFTDQSHFIREFRHFSGFNPSEYLDRAFDQNDDPNFFPLDRQG